MKTNFARNSMLRVGMFLQTFFLLTAFGAYAQVKVDYGKSYVNITKGAAGGTVEPGDILEVRALFVVSGSGVNDYADNCRFFDAIPIGTTYVPGTINVLTNEGKIYKHFTDTYGDDAGVYNGGYVTVYLGYNNAPQATPTAGGRITYSDKPSFYGSTCIMIASYRVQVTASYGTTLDLGQGNIRYKPYGGSLAAIILPHNYVKVFQNLGICDNFSGGNAILSESGGTFGSGKNKNRGTSNKMDPVNYTYANFGPNAPQDYYYCVSNNTSTGGSGYTTSNAWPIPDGSPSHRVFGVWDIIGDHTGATDPNLGNPAADTVNSTGGYMLVVNSSYKVGNTFYDTVSNLCPNTYYQYYAWFRNICSRCGCDSNGVGAGGSGYIPVATGDSSGVYPNLTFNVNSTDYYSTGDMKHTGLWVKKGFTYLTGPTETSMIIAIRNNAPGGGGNDWAVDDIGVATCAPQIALTPNKPDTLCMGSDDTVRFRVSSFFSNYTEWQIQQSTDNGATWSSPGNDTTGAADNGSATPVYNSSTNAYEYLVSRYYQLDHTHAKVMYRLIVASTPANLSDPDCSYIASAPKQIFAVDCDMILPTAVELTGRIEDGQSMLQWHSSVETGSAQYFLERSDGDPQHFNQIGAFRGLALPGGSASYTFRDPKAPVGEVYYRLVVADQKNPYRKYSRTVLLSAGDIRFDLLNLVNPFTDEIDFSLNTPASGEAQIIVYDAYGRLIRYETRSVTRGQTPVSLSGFHNLASGMYVMQVSFEGNRLTRQLVRRKR